MKKLFFTIYLLLYFFIGISQQKELALNSNTVYRNSNHEIISFEKFTELTSGNGYILEPIFDSEGNLVEMIVEKEAIKRYAPKTISSTPQWIGHPAPDFEGKDLSGHYFNNNNLMGKVIVMKFWFSACPPCMEEIPRLNKVYRAYQDNPEVKFVSISLDHSALAQKTKQRTGFLYPVIANGKNIAAAYKVLGYPTHVVIDKNGNVEAVFQGVNQRIDDRLSKAIESALIRNDYDSSPTALAQPTEEEIQITPQSVIIDKEGKRVPFGQFIQLMRENRFELVGMSDGTVLMREVEQLRE